MRRNVQRAPIKRAGSILKMRRGKGRVTDAEDASAFEDQFRDALRTGFGVRSETTLRSIDSAFGPDRPYLNLFETMFTPDSVQRLSDFAGVRADPAASTQRVNDSSDRSGVSPDLAREVFAAFAANCAYCLARLPAARSAWPHSPGPRWRGPGGGP